MICRDIPEAGGDLLRGRLGPKGLCQALCGSIQFSNLAPHMDGQADSAPVLRYRPGYGLPDPPGGERTELGAPPIVVLVGGTDQAYVARLHQVQERQAHALVPLGNADDQTRIGADKALTCLRAPTHCALQPLRFWRRVTIERKGFGRRPALLHQHGQRHLFLVHKQRHLPDFGEVQTDTIIYRHALQVGG